MWRGLQMDTLHGIVKHLSEWASERRLVQEAMRGCERWFVNESGTIDGWAVADIRMAFRSQSLCFVSGLLSYPYFVTSLDLFASGEETEGFSTIGEYRLITRLDGEVDDDYLILDRSRQEHLWRLSGRHAALYNDDVSR
jgi:hypothetical protein